MTRFATLLGNAAILMLVAALALNIFFSRSGVGGPPTATPTVAPSPTQSSRSSPAEGFSRFTSTIHGVSIDYPSGWQVRQATERWTDGVISFGAPGVDVIFDPTLGEDLYFALASEPLRGRPDHVWREDLTLPTCPGGHVGSVLTFDGASGWVVTCGGTRGHHSALLATDTWGYAIVLNLGDEGLVDTYTSAWFVSVLETLDLLP